MGDDGRILPWKQRVAQQYQQAFEQHDAGIGDGEISVMWASSQGGCGPLKRLLRDVEKSHLPLPSQASSSSSHSIRSASATTGTLHRYPPVSFPGSSRISLDSSDTSVLSPHTLTSRPARRIRSSLTRGGSEDFHNRSSRPSFSWLSKSKLVNPSSDVLSRVSRSLNEKVISEHTTSQRLRTRQMHPPERSLSYPNSTRTRVTPISFSRQGSWNRHTMSQHKPEVTQPTQSMPERDIKASFPSMPTLQSKCHTTSITKSPHKARIKALLETIDHAGSFPGQPPSSASSTTPAGNKPAIFSRSAMRNPDDKTRSCPPSLRKSLALGMRQIAPLQPAHSNIPQSHTTTLFIPSLPLSCTQASMMEGTLPSSSKTSLLVGSGSSDSDKVVVVDAGPLDNQASTSTRPDASRRGKAKGYRSSDDRATLFFNSVSPLVSDIDPENVNDSDEDGLAQISRESIADIENSSSTPKFTVSEEENPEANISSDGASSSSYGDIDFDPAALEDACKAYDL